MTKLLPLLAFGSALLAASSALAGTPVSLRSAPIGHAGAITLADLFDGATGPAAAVVVGRGVAGSEAVLDSGEVQNAAHAAGFDWDNAQGQRRIIVAIVAEARTAAEAAGRPRRARSAQGQPQVLVYTHNLMSGDVIAASDLQWSDEAVAGAGAPRDPEQVIGKSAARGPLRAGAAVSPRDLVSPKVIHRDEMVSVDFSSEGITLSLIGKSMGDAAVGDAVEVMNTSSKKIIQAVASAPGHASIGPASEPAHPDPALRTASLP